MTCSKSKPTRTLQPIYVMCAGWARIVDMMKAFYIGLSNFGTMNLSHLEFGYACIKKENRRQADRQNDMVKL